MNDKDGWEERGTGWRVRITYKVRGERARYVDARDAITSARQLARDTSSIVIVYRVKEYEYEGERVTSMRYQDVRWATDGRDVSAIKNTRMDVMRIFGKELA